MAAERERAAEAEYQAVTIPQSLEAVVPLVLFPWVDNHQHSFGVTRPQVGDFFSQLPQPAFRLGPTASFAPAF